MKPGLSWGEYDVDANKPRVGIFEVVFFTAVRKVLEDRWSASLRSTLLLAARPTATSQPAELRASEQLSARPDWRKFHHWVKNLTPK